MIWETSWQGIVLFEDIILPNTWTIELGFDFIAQDSKLQEIAFERVKYIVNDVFEESMFINIDSPWVKKLQDIKSYKIAVPDDPIDSAIAVTLLSKLVIITKDKILFDYIKIKSILSDNIQSIFMTDDFAMVPWIHDNPVKKLTGEPAWFLREDAGCTDFIYTTKKKTEVVRDKEEWATLALDWDETKNQPIPNNHDKPSHPPIAKPWQPRIIDGGKKK